MENIPEDRILQFLPDTLEEVRKDVGLERPERLEEALDILEDWIQKQPHFRKKDFSREYLERTLISAKGSVERAKQKLDKLCTLRTLMPEFYTVTDLRSEFAPICSTIVQAVLPMLTKEHHRVFIYQILNCDFDTDGLYSFYRYILMLGEYLKHNEYCKGFYIIADYRQINVLNLITKVNPIIFGQIANLVTEGYGLRLKCALILSDSMAIDTALAVFKQVMSPKIGSRIHIVKTIDELHQHIPPEVLPADFGGEGKILKELCDEWLDVLSSPEHMEWCKEMNKATIDEAYRQIDKFNESYMGMPGSFRALSVD